MEFLVYLIRLPIDWVMATEQLSSVCIEELHGYAAGSVAVATCIDEVDPIKACCITSTFSTFAQFTLVYHILHLKNTRMRILNSVTGKDTVTGVITN